MQWYVLTSIVLVVVELPRCFTGHRLSCMFGWKSFESNTTDKIRITTHVVQRQRQHNDVGMHSSLAQLLSSQSILRSASCRGHGSRVSVAPCLAQCGSISPRVDCKQTHVSIDTHAHTNAVKDAPPLSEDPEHHVPFLPHFLAASPRTNSTRRERTPTPRLQIREALVRPLRFHHDEAMSHGWGPGLLWAWAICIRACWASGARLCRWSDEPSGRPCGGFPVVCESHRVLVSQKAARCHSGVIWQPEMWRKPYARLILRYAENSKHAIIELQCTL